LPRLYLDPMPRAFGFCFALALHAEHRKKIAYSGGGRLPGAATLVGLVLEAPTQTAGVPGTAATWVALTGTPAARALGVAVAPTTRCGCVDTACARSPRGPGPWFLGGRAALPGR
jgi:hypothetical protein